MKNPNISYGFGTQRIPSIEYPRKLHVMYYLKDVDPSFGKSRGAILSISFQRHSGRREQAPEFGHTVMETDLNLVNDLMTGQAIVDVENTTQHKIALLDIPHPQRQTATIDSQIMFRA